MRQNELVSPNEVEFGGAGYRTNVCLTRPGQCYPVFSLNGGSIAAET